MKKCFIVLENGNMFEGMRFGAPSNAAGELTFTTASGHMKTLTDPVNFGQIVLQTFPTAGNYGVIPSEMDSDRCHLAGYVVREWCETPVNHRSEGDIDHFLKSHGVAGVYGVDTRQIARILREYGSMNAAIVDEVTPDLIHSLKGRRPADAMRAVATGARAVHPAAGAAKWRVALLNYGAPHGMIRDLCARGCEVHELPFDATAEEALDRSPDALALTDGPGDPLDAPACIEELKKLTGELPVLGVGLGHLLLALAAGGRTEKLKLGHRGANQPVRDAKTGKAYVCALNQGYAVADVPEGADVRFIQMSDQRAQGLEYPGFNALSVQFIPDGALGPLRTDFVYDQFLERLVK